MNDFDIDPATIDALELLLTEEWAPSEIASEILVWEES